MRSIVNAANEPPSLNLLKIFAQIMANEEPFSRRANQEGNLHSRFSRSSGLARNQIFEVPKIRSLRINFSSLLLPQQLPV